MKKWEALTNLPFGIKKGDIITELKKGQYVDSNTNNIPMDVSKETTFFKKIKEIPLAFEVGSYVVLQKQENCRQFSDGKYLSSNYFTIPAWTEVRIVGSVERYKKPHAVIDFNGKKYEIAEINLVKYEFYYFINSSGEIHKTVLGKNVPVDTFRIKSDNAYPDYTSAKKMLDKIMGTPVVLKKKEPKKTVSVE